MSSNVTNPDIILQKILKFSINQPFSTPLERVFLLSIHIDSTISRMPHTPLTIFIHLQPRTIHHQIFEFIFRQCSFLIFDERKTVLIGDVNISSLASYLIGIVIFLYLHNGHTAVHEANKGLYQHITYFLGFLVLINLLELFYDYMKMVTYQVVLLLLLILLLLICVKIIQRVQIVGLNWMEFDLDIGQKIQEQFPFLDDFSITILTCIQCFPLLGDCYISRSLFLTLAFFLQCLNKLASSCLQQILLVSFQSSVYPRTIHNGLKFDWIMEYKNAYLIDDC